jgi:phosphoglucomutase
VSLDAEVLKRAEYWATSEAFDKETRLEIQNLITTKNQSELVERFYRDLEFGTGGLRGIMGAGTSRMNLYNVRKATTALALYLKEQFPGIAIQVALSHDCRNQARAFAKASAEVLAAYGIRSLITIELRPTPMLSFAVRHFGCQAGICVTASHNPAVYNGYKVYWETGGQLVPPHDKAIIKHYAAIKDYASLKHIPYEEALQKNLIKEVGDELDDAYFARLAGVQLRRPEFQPKIVYTPIHGTGITAIPRALKMFGFEDLHIVPEQAEPNGNFPTVVSPNPEDHEALEMAIALGEKIRADLILATDPDSDRIAVVVRENEKFIQMNGNQLCCLLTEYVLSSQKEKGTLPQDPLVIKTIVTSELERDIAHHWGASCEDTLTGFKWICDVIEAYESGKRTPYRKFVCGGEESYGFMCDSFVRDKDAIVGCAIAAEMVAYYRSQGKTLSQVLDDIFLRHGVYHESLYTLVLPGKAGADKIHSMMVNFRNHPPKTLDHLKVVKIWDLETSKETVIGESLGQNAVHPIELPKSDVLQFFLEDGSKISVRPSGTEPKIKFYISVKQAIKGQSISSLEEAKKNAQQRVKNLEDAFVALAK